jgi:hypothetical protein
MAGCVRVRVCVCDKPGMIRVLMFNLVVLMAGLRACACACVCVSVDLACLMSNPVVLMAAVCVRVRVRAVRGDPPSLTSNPMAPTAILACACVRARACPGRSCPVRP